MHEPVAQQLEREPSRRRPEVSFERAGGDGAEGTGRDQLAKAPGPVLEDRGALGMREDDRRPARAGSPAADGVRARGPAPTAWRRRASQPPRARSRLPYTARGRSRPPRAGGPVSRRPRSPPRARWASAGCGAGWRRWRACRARRRCARARALPRRCRARRRSRAARGSADRSAPPPGARLRGQYAPRPESTTGSVASRISMSRASDQPATYW